MKITVNRKLASGIYHVWFNVGDFTPEEVAKMQSFGPPAISLSQGIQGQSLASAVLGLPRINDEWVAGFRSEADAKKYEERVLNDIKQAMILLRAQKDHFTSTDEVNF